MHLPRSRFETACRVSAFGLLGWLLGTSVIRVPHRDVQIATNATVAARLPAWTRATDNSALHVTMTGPPSADAIDWLGALRRSGRAVTWAGTPPALAVVAEPLLDPGGGTRIAMAAPSGAVLAARDEAGSLDTVRASSLGAAIEAPL